MKYTLLMKGLLKLAVILPALGVLGLFLTALPATAAEKYPVKPIKVIVAFQAGGTSDILCRFYTQQMQKYLGQPLVVENHPGAGGVEGITSVVAANPDGYTLLRIDLTTIPMSHYLLGAATTNRDLEPIVNDSSHPVILAVSSKTDLKSVKELVAYSQRNPKRLLVGINPGSSSHFETLSIMKALGIEPKYVSYKSGAERAVALAGGHLEVSVDSYAALHSYFDAKKIRPLAITSLASAMEIPSFKELGADISVFRRAGWYAPKGTPETVMQILESAVEKASKEKILLDQFAKAFVNVDFQKRGMFRNSVMEEDEKIKALASELRPPKR